MLIKHKFNNNILRAYDIRGIIDEDLNEEDAFMLGYFFCLFLRDKIPNKKFPKIVISRDGRISSPNLEKSLINGLLKSGADIISLGINPTPTLYFGNQLFEADAAIQITGSHNPKSYNGFKMIMMNKSFFGQDIVKLSHFAEKGSEKSLTGKLNINNIEDYYIDEILKPLEKSNINKLSNLNIVWDCGNGATGNIINKLIKKVPGKHKVLFSEIDGSFPNHHPDPTKEKNLKELISEIKKSKADIGIAFDGDGDRIGIVDKNGNLIPGDLLTAFLCLSIENKNQTIILDVKSSLIPIKIIKRLGFEVEIWKTGHSHVKSRLHEINSPLAGEMSGHIFFKDKYFGFDDAIYTSIRVIDLLAQGYNITNFNNNVEKSYTTPELKLKCSDQKKFLVINNIINKLRKKYKKENILLIDGIRVNNISGWYLIRASNTENAIIIRVEGLSKNKKELLLKEVSELIKLEGLNLETKFD